MRVLYVERADLRNGEDSGGDNQTPYATGMQRLHQEVRANTAEKSAKEAANGKDRHMKLLIQCQLFVIDGVVPMFP